VQAGNNGKPANDLLDQRDKLVSDLSKEIKVTVVKQGSEYNIAIGNGQSLVVGGKTFQLTPVTSITDPSRLQVGYKGNNGTISLSEASLTGGKLGGLLEFRSQTLDQVQNELGRLAIGLGSAFNAQHQLGQDLNGALGGDFFKVATPLVNASTLNTGNAQVAVNINDAGALTASDYRFEFIGPAEYRVTRMADGALTSATTLPITVDGLQFQVASGSMAAGDVFLVKPTTNGASGMDVAITDTAKIAAAVPIRTAAETANTGSGQISAGTVSPSYTAATVTPAVSLSFDAGTGTLSGFPALPVTVTTSSGTQTTYPAGTAVPYTEGATISFGGLSFTITGTPANGDTFTIGRNTNGVGDNRNALLLGALQTAKTLMNGTSTIQGAYGQMINMVGNKTHELDVNMTAENTLLEQAIAAQQSESGVNLDEEAANLLRYQQAYQAAGKVMQTASKLFDVLLSLGS
jgi:flagellar hook-associated protein 1 FlgK